MSPMDWLSGICGCPEGAFESDLADYHGTDWCRSTGSGTVALFASLQALAARSSRKEVVLPAYTAPSLILPIRKAGLQPVLCDVDLDTLNAGPAQMLGRTGTNTLAILPVHMFGNPTDVAAMVDGLRGSGTCVIEDACSSMGSAIEGRRTGSFGDIGFVSFNRGKNMATLAGGALFAQDPALRSDLEAIVDAVPGPGLKQRLLTPVLAAGLGAAVRPLGYSLLYPVVSRFKYTELHTDFQVKAFSRFQAGLGRRLLKRFDVMAAARRERAERLRAGLSDIDGVRLPETLPLVDVVFNQFPMLLPDPDCRERVHQAILQTGLEATQLYPNPIHRIYDDLKSGSGDDPFPNATTISKRLLLIPVHPTVPLTALDRAVTTIRSAMTGPSSPGG